MVRHFIIPEPQHAKPLIFEPLGERCGPSIGAYDEPMTKLLDKALEAVRRLPPSSQDEIAQAMLTLAGGEGEPEVIDRAHLPAVLEGLAQAKCRQFAPEVEAAFRRFDQ
jgi:hypothetical protein